MRGEQGEALAHAQSPPGGREGGIMAAPWEALRAAMAAVLLLGWGAQGLYFHIGETEKRCFIEEIPDETMVIGNYRTQLWDKQSESFLPSTPGLGMHVEVKDPDGKVRKAGHQLGIPWARGGVPGHSLGGFGQSPGCAPVPRAVAVSPWDANSHAMALTLSPRWHRWCQWPCHGPDSVPPLAQVVMSRQYGSEGRFTFTSHTPGEHQICLHSNSTRMALFAGGKLRVHLDIQVGEHTNNYPEIAAKDKLTELQLRARQLLDQVEQIQKEQNYQRYREERFRMTSESTNQRVLWWSIAQTVILILTGLWQMRHLKSFFEAKKLV
uniref:Uncharacterized protein n=2 Tax=Passeriformes TaxID=9126 RepID=A0A8C3MSP8_GEOPR